MSINKIPNRLITEKSPYLLQHAYNPVDWFPWGEEVFEKAIKENKPIFLSIGYSTCHWWHVHKSIHVLTPYKLTDKIKYKMDTNILKIHNLLNGIHL